MYHMKFKSKISYLGEKITILPWQMAEQLAVEVNVKNVMEHTGAAASAGQALVFDLDLQHALLLYEIHIARLCN